MGHDNIQGVIPMIPVQWITRGNAFFVTITNPYNDSM